MYSLTKSIGMRSAIEACSYLGYGGVKLDAIAIIILFYTIERSVQDKI